MYTTPQIYNSLPPLTQPPANFSTPKNKRNLWTIIATTVAVGLAVFLLIYTGGMGSLLKLLGVGASGVYEIKISSANDFLGIGKNWFVGPANPNGVNAFSNFSIVPEDVDLTDEGRGLILPIFSSPSDPASEIYTIHEYTSMAVDLDSVAPFLSAIQTTYYNPVGTGSEYSYRTASSVAGLDNQPFAPLDFTVTNNLDNDIKIGAAIVEQPISQFIQIKIAFINNTASLRSAVYALDIQYKEDANIIDVKNLPNVNGEVIDREITIEYELSNAPASAEINIISGDLNNAIVHSANNVDFTGKTKLSFKTALVSNQAHALTISAPLTNTIIIPFNPGSDSAIKLNAGSFKLSTGGMSAGDLNGDGVVNSIDYLMQYDQLGTQ